MAMHLIPAFLAAFIPTTESSNTIHSSGSTPISEAALRYISGSGLAFLTWSLASFSSKNRSKSVNEFSEQEFDYVITVCDNARQSCPFFPGQCEFMHWNLEDPAEAQGSEEERLSVFRKVRDQIRDNILKMTSKPGTT